MTQLKSPNISQDAQQAFRKNKTQIIDTLIANLLEKPGAFDHLGDQAEQVLRSGFEFTVNTLDACMQVNDISLLADQLNWAEDRLPHDGISMERMKMNLDSFCLVISEIIPSPLDNEIIGLVQTMIKPQDESSGAA